MNIVSMCGINVYLCIVGLLLAVWTGSYVLTEVSRRVIAYINDTEVKRYNPVNKLVIKVFKIDTYFYGEAVFFLPIVSAFVISLCIYFYWLTMYLVFAYGLLYTTRSIRRLHTKLSKHVEDKDAHKLGDKNE